MSSNTDSIVYFFADGRFTVRTLNRETAGASQRLDDGLESRAHSSGPNCWN